MEVNDLSKPVDSSIHGRHRESHTLSFSFELDKILSNCEVDWIWVIDIVYKQCAPGCHVLPWHVLMKNLPDSHPGYDITNPKSGKQIPSHPAKAVSLDLLTSDRLQIVGSEWVILKWLSHKTLFLMPSILDTWRSDIQQIESEDMLVSWLFFEVYSCMDFQVMLSHSTSGLISGKSAKYTMHTVQPLGLTSCFFKILLERCLEYLRI